MALTWSLSFPARFAMEKTFIGPEFHMSHVNLLLQEKQQLIERFSCKNNLIALWQMISTLLLFAGCWWLAVIGLSVSTPLVMGAVVGIVL